MVVPNVSAHVQSRVCDDGLIVRDEASGIEHTLTGVTRGVFERIQAGEARPAIVDMLASDPFVGPLRASDVYDLVIADLSDRRLVRRRPSGSSLASVATRAVPRSYPWYDSPWLGRWMGARDLAAVEDVDVAAELLSQAAPLRTELDFGTHDLGQVADSTLLANTREVVESLDPVATKSYESDSFGRVLLHNHPYFNDLHQAFLPLACEAAGEELEPSYNFLSLYTSRGVCAPHMDAPSAKYTLDLCIDQSDPWPIHISQVVPWPEDWDDPGDDWAERIRSSPDLEFQSYVLEPGQAIFFAGSSQWHYRDVYQTADDGICHLIFLHFIPKGTREFVRLFDPYLV